ncbi:MAG: AarF/ABC1/UbiB kinase family protein [Bdellovibrionaceae bacterium]|nr:AarF/ABC1/UbiB kinase family protein [Pseudobdellovibrionaceae bacterium]
MSFEELGPTFVKLGQVLATRPDLVPEEYIAEFEKLHDRVQPLPFEKIQTILEDEFGTDLKDVFEFVDPNPLGSASIAQVHAARLATGEKVVLKVQRPGIIRKIADDLDVLYMLAELLERYLPEARPLNPVIVVSEFFKALQLETNFIVEANNLRRFSENFSSEKNPVNAAVKIPKVYLELSTERVLVMEALPGIPLSQDNALRQEGVDPHEIIRIGLRTYLKMVFIDGFFHGDLHAGNVLVMPDNKVGLIDFGVVGRLNPKTQASIANMLLALSKEDYDRLALEYVDLAPFTDKVNVELFARELRELIAPFFGLTLKNFNAGKVLMSSASIASRHHLTVPAELMIFFKSIVAIEGLGRRIDKDFDFLQASLEFTGEIVKHQLDPQRLLTDFGQLMRESGHLINALPRQLSFLLRKMNSPDYAQRLDVPALDDLKKSVEVSFNLLFLGVIIGSLIVSGSLIYAFPGDFHRILGMPTLSFILYFIAGVLGIVGFFNYIRKP